MVMVRYAACPWTEVFAPCSAIVVPLNQAGNGTGRWQIGPLLKVEGEWKVISKIYHTHVAP